MGMQRTARRRRVQARNGYNHVSRIADGRPIYGSRSASKSARLEQRRREKAALIQQRKGMSNKK